MYIVLVQDQTHKKLHSNRLFEVEGMVIGMDNSIEKKRIEGEEDLISTIKVATAALPLIFTIAEKLSKQHGFIHDSVPARFGDKTGRLVWDYILYNEITFDSEDGKIISLFTSLSDAETKKRWDVLVDKYGL